MKNNFIETKKENDEIFIINMLGDFKVYINNVLKIKKIGRSKKLFNLLAFLLINKHKVVSQNDIIYCLWPDKNSSDPINALKNLIYRLRNILIDDFGFPDHEYIVFMNGTYMINPELNIKLDTEEFIELYNSLSISNEEEVQFENLKKAVKLYQGDFLNTLSSEDWIVPISTNFHNMYIECVYKLISLYEKHENYQAILEVCNKTIIFDQFDEHIHLYILKAYVKCDKLNKAIIHYDNISTQFYKELGLLPSNDLYNAYKQILLESNFELTNIESIKEELKETQNIDGAYMCDYESFKHFYRIESRSLSRNGQSIFICLLTLNYSGKEKTSDKTALTSIKQLLDLTLACLRSGDIVARYNKTQFVVMLKSLTFEDGEMVLNRLINKFNQKNQDHDIKVTFRLQEIEPSN